MPTKPPHQVSSHEFQNPHPPRPPIHYSLLTIHYFYETNPIYHPAVWLGMGEDIDGRIGARMPLVPNPDYNQTVYESDSLYDRRLLWGPFEGTRPAESDEQ
ncbi:MAG: hypothetical protein J7M40_13205 [Planctomycetes bacterium]|nr:hypothetical protein [Planctomycetota bacterium]